MSSRDNMRAEAPHQISRSQNHDGERHGNHWRSGLPIRISRAATLTLATGTRAIAELQGNRHHGGERRYQAQDVHRKEVHLRFLIALGIRRDHQKNRCDGCGKRNIKQQQRQRHSRWQLEIEVIRQSNELEPDVKDEVETLQQCDD